MLIFKLFNKEVYLILIMLLLIIVIDFGSFFNLSILLEDKINFLFNGKLGNVLELEFVVIMIFLGMIIFFFCVGLLNVIVIVLEIGEKMEGFKIVFLFVKILILFFLYKFLIFLCNCLIIFFFCCCILEKLMDVVFVLILKEVVCFKVLKIFVFFNKVFVGI